jgi:hypothetical protein
MLSSTRCCQTSSVIGVFNPRLRYGGYEIRMRDRFLKILKWSVGKRSRGNEWKVKMGIHKNVLKVEDGLSAQGSCLVASFGVQR